MSSRRVLTLSLLSVVLVLSVAGCGGSDPEPSPSPSTTPSRTSSSTPTTASPSPSASPLSKFEDDPAVQGLRAWAAAAAKDVNANGPTGAMDFANLTPLTVKASVDDGLLPRLGGADIKDNLLYPGPLPFTPVDVQASASRTTIAACVWEEGWAVDRTTGKPPQKKVIYPDDITMVRSSSGVWQVEQFRGNPDRSCKGIRVRGVR